MVNKILSLVVSSVVVFWGTSALAGPGLVLQGVRLNGPGLVLQGLPTNGIQPNALGDNGIKLNGIVDVQESKQRSSDEKHLTQLMRKTELSAEVVKLP